MELYAREVNWKEVVRISQYFKFENSSEVGWNSILIQLLRIHVELGEFQYRYNFVEDCICILESGVHNSFSLPTPLQVIVLLLW